jgi:hypothetical protein
MSTLLRLSALHSLARLAGTRAGADDHATAHSYIDFYDSEPVQTLDEVSDRPACVRVVLTKPCGAIVDGVLVLAQQDASGDLIALDSLEAGLQWARWFTAAGVPWADGDVSDEAGTGFYKLKGTSGTRVFAGGRAVLGQVLMS